jgi:hypothetical protein
MDTQFLPTCHAIPVVQYDPRGLTVITWGAPKRMSWGFVDAYCDDAYGVLSQDWVDMKTNLTPDKFNLPTLQTDLNEIVNVSPGSA